MICPASWMMIDEEFIEVGSDTGQSAFGSISREITVYRTWKATKYRQLVFNYYLVVFDSHEPKRILFGFRMFVLIIIIWPRPSLSIQKVGKVDNLAPSFFC